MKFGKIVATTFTVFTTCACAANTWWVDDDWYGQGGNGTEERPFGTIQDAVEAASVGDTVMVKAGVYNKGATQNTTYEGHRRLAKVIAARLLTMPTDFKAAASR